MDDEKVAEYEGQALTLLSVGSKISIKWSTTTVLQHQDAEVIFFDPGNRLHGVKYTDDNTFLDSLFVAAICTPPNVEVDQPT